MIAHHNTAETVRLVLKTCGRYGVDAKELLDLAGIPDRVVNDPEGRVTLDQMQAFWQRAYHLSGEPSLALRAAEVTEFGAFAPIDYFFSAAGSFSEGMRRFARYFPIINTWLSWRVEDFNGGGVLVLESALPRVPPPAAEYAFTVITLRARRLCGPAWRSDRVDFHFPAPPSTAPYESLFGCLITFDATAPRMSIGPDAWLHEVGSADPKLLALLDSHARMLMERTPPPADLIGQVRQALARELAGGDWSRERIAASLGMSARTLQRRLNALGQGYAEVVEKLRRELADSYLRRPNLALCEIGFLLGFKEQSSFTRSFRRWSGVTPSEYRRTFGSAPP